MVTEVLRCSTGAQCEQCFCFDDAWSPLISTLLWLCFVNPSFFEELCSLPVWICLLRLILSLLFSCTDFLFVWTCALRLCFVWVSELQRIHQSPPVFRASALSRGRSLLRLRHLCIQWRAASRFWTGISVGVVTEGPSRGVMSSNQVLSCG